MGVIREELSQADISDATKRVADSADSSNTDSVADDTAPSGDPVADFYRRLRKRTSPKRS